MTSHFFTAFFLYFFLSFGIVPLISYSRKFSQANRYKVLNTPRPLLFFWVGINSSFFLREMSSKCLKCLEMLIDAWFFIFLIEATIGIDIVCDQFVLSPPRSPSLWYHKHVMHYDIHLFKLICYAIL